MNSFADRVRAPLARWIVVIAVAVYYGRTLYYGFYWDDYHFVHPYRLDDVLAAWRGPWDASGIEPAFYRPLAIAFYAARSALLGYSAPGHHALSIVLCGIVALLSMSWFERLGCRRTTSLIGPLVLVFHPVSIWTTAWVTNHLHLLNLLLMLSAFVMATDHPERWRRVLVFQVLILGFKEDGLVLGPALAALWWTRKRQIPAGWILLTVILTVAYLGVRSWALEGIGGYPRGDMVMRFLVAPMSLLLLPPYNGGIVGTSAVVTLCILASHRGIARNHPLVFAALLLVMYCAPLAFTTPYPSRWYMLPMSIAVVVAAAPEYLQRYTIGRVISLAALAAFVFAGWSVMGEFHPCSANVRRRDREVATWGAAVSPPLKALLAAKTCTTDR